MNKPPLSERRNKPKRFDCPDCDYETDDPKKYRGHQWIHQLAKRAVDK